MSITVGIGLTLVYIPKRNLETVKFHWHTSYGYFEIINLKDLFGI